MNFTIVFIVLIAAMLSALILSSYFYRSLNVRFNSVSNSSSLVQSGVAYGLANFDQLSDFEKSSNQLFEEELSVVEIERQPWGTLDVLRVKDSKLTAAVLVGYELGQIGKSSLYLEDNNSALYLSGRASIAGSCYLPYAGVSYGALEGLSFDGTTRIGGKRLKSQTSLPQIKNAAIENTSFTYSQVPIKQLEVLEPVMSYSFREDTLGLYNSTGPITLSNIIDGRVVIKSDVSITVKQNADISQAILVAPKILVESYFEGDFQAFVTESFDLEDYANLNYPSVVICSSQDKGTVNLHPNSTMTGSIFSLSEKGNAFVGLQTSSRLVGQLFNQGNTEVKGEFDGNLITRFFYLDLGGRIYRNYLHNARLDMGIANIYVGPRIEENQNVPQVIAWLP